MKIKKFIINIILGLVPSKAMRKNLRNKWLYNANSNKIILDENVNKLNNNIIVISPNNQKSYNEQIKGLDIN